MRLLHTQRIAMSPLLNQLNLNHLVHLETLLSTESVTKAAKQVGISQSAMSHVLAQLRSHFEDPLLIRSVNGHVKTAFSQRLLLPLQEALIGLSACLDHKSHFEPAQYSGEFRIATGDFIVPTLEQLSTKDGRSKTIRHLSTGEVLIPKLLFNASTQEKPIFSSAPHLPKSQALPPCHWESFLMSAPWPINRNVPQPFYL